MELRAVSEEPGRAGLAGPDWSAEAKKHAAGLRTPEVKRFYSRPEVRKRVTGSITGTGCRWKIQRATA